MKKLDLGKNKIKVIENIDQLENLIQLSLEDNEIISIANMNSFLTSLKNLMELYLGNNRISEFKEMKLLKNLSKLIILGKETNKGIVFI